VRDGVFRSGWNAVQVQKFLGHADPEFTLRRYVHLLDEDLPVPGVLARTRHAGDNAVVTRPTENHRDARVVAEVR
jgi:hypothetical protein